MVGQGVLRECRASEKIAAYILLAMVTAMGIWLPKNFLPAALFVYAAHFTRTAIPFRTEDSSRWFRVAKWMATAIAALLPLIPEAPSPWLSAMFLAFLFILFDLRSIAIRRKLLIEQRPARLYW